MRALVDWNTVPDPTVFGRWLRRGGREITQAIYTPMHTTFRYVSLRCMATATICLAHAGCAADTSPTVDGTAVSVDASVGELGVAVEECKPISENIQGSIGTFSILECLPADGDEQAKVIVRFVHRGADGQVTADHAVDRDSYSATAGEIAPQFWDGHVVTVDLAQERDGTLLIASLVGERIVVTARSYHTSDDDSLVLAWYDGALVTTTEADGQLRLVEMGADQAAPGTFEQESLACKGETDGGTEHSIRLAIDTDGRVTGLDYLSLSPAVDGTMMSCTIKAERGDGDSEWSYNGRGGSTVALGTFEQGEEDSRDRVRIERDEELYDVVVDAEPVPYCGQSAQLARRIVLRPGSRRCDSVALPTTE